MATGQTATCWIARAGRTFYASNAGSGSVSQVAAAAGAKLTLVSNTSTDDGTVDAAVSGDGAFLYVQTGARGIVDEFRVDRIGSLSSIGRETVTDAQGGQGIVAT